jgi:hypothetical protein
MGKKQDAKDAKKAAKKAAAAGASGASGAKPDDGTASDEGMPEPEDDDGSVEGGKPFST